MQKVPPAALSQLTRSFHKRKGQGFEHVVTCFFNQSQCRLNHLIKTCFFFFSENQFTLREVTQLFTY